MSRSFIATNYPRAEYMPMGWALGRLKNLLRRKITDGPHSTPVFLDEGVPFLSVDGIKDGELCFKKCRYISPEDYAEFRKKADPEKGDILLGKAASTGKVAIVRTRRTFSIWSPLALIKLDKLKACSDYVWYSMGAKFFQAEVDDYCTSNTQKNISMDDIPRLPLFIPPLFEQRQIAAYLNRETAKIDKLITKQQKLIKLLKEKRQAVISQTVTKGLDSNVDYEVTDRTLTGRYPRSWTLSKIGREVKIAEGQVDPKESPFDEFILIAPNHIEKSTGRILNLEKAVDQGAESGKYLCKKGEIIYSKIRPALCKVALSPVDCLCSADMYPMSSLGRVSNEFLFYFLLSDAFTKLAVLESERVAMPKINRESLTAMSIVFPSLEEQEKIVSFIESQIKHCDALINKSNQSMRLLIEHRQALITAAVTGKIDVRGLVTDEEVAALDADPVLEATEEDFESEVAEADYITEEE